MIIQKMELISSPDVVRNLCKKMAPPLVTLLSAEPEIQYVALRNINLIVQRRPTILAHEIKVIQRDLFSYPRPIQVISFVIHFLLILTIYLNISGVSCNFIFNF